MTTAYVVFVAGVLLTAAVSVAVGVWAPWRRDGGRRLTRGFVAAYDDVRRDLGTHWSALVVLLATAAAAIIVTWPFGRLARRTQPHFDVPFYKWTLRHLDRTGGWHRANEFLTGMGNRPQIKLILFVAAIVFGALWAWRRIGWWKPALVLFATFVFEKYGQSILKLEADRGTANAGAGSFPSGGCARLITAYGIVFFLALVTWPSIARRWRIAGWTTLAVLAFVEGYTRLFLFKHWLTDVLGGWLFGALMLLALIAATRCLAGAGRRSGEPAATASASGIPRTRTAAGQPDR